MAAGQGAAGAHVELAGRRQLHRQRDLLAARGHDRLVDGHVRERGRELGRRRLGGRRRGLPRGHDVAGRRHEHAPVHDVVRQELVLAACARARGMGAPPRAGPGGAGMHARAMLRGAVATGGPAAAGRRRGEAQASEAGGLPAVGRCRAVGRVR